MKTFKTYKEQAKNQNMEVARVKAIAILEYLEEKTNIDLCGMEWYQLEDHIATIINSK